MDSVKSYLVGWKTIPNLLSFIRIILVPVFGVLFYNGHHVAAIIILVISGLTDFFDGKIARKYNQVSALGKVLDPIADKITMLTLAILLFLEFRNSGNDTLRAFSWVFLVFLIKEGIFVIGGAITIAIGILPGAAEIYGKIATFVFYVVAILLFLFGPAIGLIKFLVLPDIVCGILVCISALMTVIAFVSYIPGILRSFKRYSEEKEKGEKE